MKVLFNKKTETIEKFLSYINDKLHANIFLKYNNNKYYLIDKSEKNIQIKINDIVVTKRIYWNIQRGDYILVSNKLEALIINDDTDINEERTSDVKLPFCFPRIRTYPYFTALIATLDAYNVADNWIYNNYLLIWIMGSIHSIDYWADFKYGDEKKQEYFCKQIKKEIITRQSIKGNYKSITDFIKKSIQSKKYIFVGVDTFFIQQWLQEGLERQHYRHQVYIYGYNEEKKYIIMSDFVNGEYKSIKVPFEEFDEAYNNYNNAPIVYVKYAQKIWLISYNFNNIEKINVKRISYLLEDFLNSRDKKIKSYLWEIQRRNDLKYGLEYYDELIKSIQEDESEEIDCRVIHILVELNSIMKERMSYLDMNGKIILTDLCKTNLEDLVLETNKMQNLAIKYNLTKNNRYLQHLLGYLKRLKDKQEKTFSMCLQCIKNGK